MNVYIIEVFDETKNTFVFWNAVKDCKKAELMIYKYLAEYDEFGLPEVKVSKALNDYTYFTGSYTVCTGYGDDGTGFDQIKCDFRCHPVTIND